MKEIQLKSGNILKFGLPSIEKSLKLTNIIAKTFSEHGLNIKLNRDTEINIGKMFFDNQEACLKGLADVVFNEDVAKIVMECAANCLYVAENKQMKITLDTFDIEAYRADYYEIMLKIAWENIKPFFGNLLTKS